MTVEQVSTGFVQEQSVMKNMKGGANDESDGLV